MEKTSILQTATAEQLFETFCIAKDALRDTIPVFGRVCVFMPCPEHTQQKEGGAQQGDDEHRLTTILQPPPPSRSCRVVDNNRQDKAATEAHNRHPQLTNFVNAPQDILNCVRAVIETGVLHLVANVVLNIIVVNLHASIFPLTGPILA